MKPSSYYDIPENAYIFGKQVKPEEKVRQWVIYELLSKFGENINNIKLEIPVKVGTRTHFADIVLYENHIPNIVIECKRKEDADFKTALNQAISYASSQEINAKHAIATNGIYWKYAYRTVNGWEEAIEIKSLKYGSEIPQKLESLMGVFSDFKLIGGDLIETIPSNNISRFFGYLQNFYTGCIFITDVDRDLFRGTDYMMRAVAFDPLMKGESPENNLTAALNRYCKFSLKNGYLDSNFLPENIGSLNQKEKISNIIAIFEEISTKRKVKTLESKLCDLTLSISMYLMEVQQHGEVRNFSARNCALIYEYIDHIFRSKLNIRLPNTNEDLLEFNAYCTNKMHD